MPAKAGLETYVGDFVNPVAVERGWGVRGEGVEQPVNLWIQAVRDGTRRGRRQPFQRCSLASPRGRGWVLASSRALPIGGLSAGIEAGAPGRPEAGSVKVQMPQTGQTIQV